MEGNFVLKIFMVEDKLLSANVEEVIVDTNVFLPTMFTVLIEDSPDPIIGSLMYTDIDPRFSVGSPVAIKYEEIDITKGFIPKIGTLVEGEITSIEPVFDGDGRALLRIRGYDRLHRLMRGKKTRAFNMMNDTMLFSMIANESGMMPVPTGLPTKVYENIIQCNQSAVIRLSDICRRYEAKSW
jgi:hypothetical protein